MSVDNLQRCCPDASLKETKMPCRTYAVATMVLLLASCNSGQPGDQPASEQMSGGTTNDTTTGQSEARGREGDTLLVFLHHVKPGRQKEYEALISEIWGSALRKAAAAGKEEWQYTMTATRDLVPLSPVPAESTATYLYLIDPAPPNFMSDSGSFPQTLLMDAGYSREQADSIGKRLGAVVRRWEFYAPVQRAFHRRSQEASTSGS